MRFSGFDDEWKSFKLSEISKRITRKNKSLETDRPLTISAQYGLVDQIEYFNKIVASKSLKGYYLLNKGEFAYNKSYSNGYPFGAVKRLDDYENGAISTLYICFNTNDKMNSDLLKEYFETDKWHEEIYKIAVEGARNHGLLNVAVGDFFNTKHVLPTNNHEQEKIAKFLIEINTKIDLLENKHKAYQDFKKYLMQKIFAQELRFKSADGEQYSDWKERNLYEFLTEHKLKSTGNEEVYSVSVHKGLVNQKEHLGRDFSAPDTSKYNLVKPGDIVYTKSPTGDFPLGIIKQSRVDKNVIVSPLYGVFTPETYALGYILNDYFESNVNTHNYLHPIVQKGAKNTMNITNKTFLSKTLFVPTDVNEQQKIAECFSKVNDSIRNIEIQQNKVNEFKKGLLQQMFVVRINWRCNFKLAKSPSFNKHLLILKNKIIFIIIE